MLTLITTCMGRRPHLEQTLPIFLRQFEQVIVVDWNCPELSGHWAANQGATVEFAGREVPHPEIFWKTRACNLGAARARALGATVLCFSDADTIMSEGFRRELDDLEPDQIAVANPDTHPNLQGFITVHAEKFFRVGGYDESYIGWSYEDMDLRLRLMVDAGCRAKFLQGSVFRPLVHENALRHANQPETLVESYQRNRRKFLDALRPRLSEWSSELKEALPYR